MGAIKILLTFVQPSRKTFLEVVRQSLLPLVLNLHLVRCWALGLPTNHRLEVVGRSRAVCDEPGEQFGDELQIHQHFYWWLIPMLECNLYLKEMDLSERFLTDQGLGFFRVALGQSWQLKGTIDTIGTRAFWCRHIKDKSISWSLVYLLLLYQ